jgi:hypothetical protein
MRINKRRLLGLVAALPLAWLTACGGGGDDGNDANIRLINASPSYAALDLYIEDEKQASAVAFGAGSEFASVTNGGDVERTLTAAGSTVELLNQVGSLDSGERYTVVAYGWEGALKSVIMTEDEDAADNDKTKVSALNIAADAGELDVYLTGEDDLLEASTPVASGVDAGGQSSFNSVSSGTYRLRVTGHGDTDDLRLDVSGVVLSSEKVLTLILTPGQGGVLVHAIGAVQDGAVTPYLNTKARARLVAAVAGGGIVTASAGETSLGTGVLSSQTRDYVLVDAGPTTLHTMVNGTALADKSVTLEAGSDVTVVVTGNDAATAIVNAVPDENRLPTSSTEYRVRMVHAAPSFAGESLSLTVDASSIVNDLQFGLASDYSDETADDSANLDIISPVQGTIFTMEDQNLAAKGLYTVFVFDFTVNGVVETRGVLRKDR